MRLKIGGMALENGVLFQTAEHWSAAVRQTDGTIAVAGGAKGLSLAARSEVESIPLLRGPLRLVEGMVALAQAKRALPQAKLPLQSPAVLGTMALSTVALTSLRGRRGKVTPALALGQELAAVALSLAPAVVALRGSNLAAYHGAEHKSIAAYEQSVGSDPTAAADAAAAAREHERCGSNLVGPLLALNAVGSAAVRASARGPLPGANAAVGLLSLMGAFELVRWAAKHPGARVTRWLLAPGELLQRRLTTREPAAEQLAVAQTALARLLDLEQGGGESAAGRVDALSPVAP